MWEATPDASRRHLPQEEAIDLLNVAFENPRRSKAKKDENRSPGKQKNQADVAVLSSDVDQTTVSYLVPDRVAGLEELEELRSICPKRIWNFVCYLRATMSSIWVLTT